VLFENPTRKFKFHYSNTRITSTLHEDQCTFITVTRSMLLRVRNISDKSCTENQHKFYVQHFFFPEKTCLLWDSLEKYGTARQATDDD